MFGEKFATRLNSFTSKPEIYWDKKVSDLTVDMLINRASTVKGLTDLDLNYPDHAGNNLKNTIKIIKDNGLGQVTLRNLLLII